ncbi:S8 family serine peptidase [Bifidobacterium imperatoris]|uniref:Peptidase S8 n=1 Tax=Bifidobacterium imperatoris TaxID=2020965 RepID=A0A2N5IS61_9BIFI|nr:S8 family serine peptidase [Bifidobacterium imperatoris]PLS24799.1 peptidase S8 [Bifidobacterium imperatoris]QSY57981.1 S8 family serine peptidase [Bifidobacterium imperatoris]
MTTLRNAAACGISIALAAGLCLAGLASSAQAETASTVVSPAAQEDGVRNYVLNLPENTSANQLAAVVNAAEQLGAKPLMQYPQLHAVFVQAQAKDFAQQVAAASQKAGVTLDSVGTTRTAVVTGQEDLFGDDSSNASSGADNNDDVSAQSEAKLENEESQSYKTAKNSAQSKDADASDTDSTNANGPTASSESDPDVTEDKAWGVIATGASQALPVIEHNVELAKTVVGILDSGVDDTHPDIAPNFDAADSANCNVNGIPDNSYGAWRPTSNAHGTHTAGTVAAAHNGIGVDGVDPQATIAAVKTGNDDGLLYPEYVTCAMVWAADHHFAATNNSYSVDPWLYWVPSDPTQTAGYEIIRRAVAYATSQNVVTVVAAGNENSDLDHPTTDSESPYDGTAIPDRDVSNGVQLPSMLPGTVIVSSSRKASVTNPGAGMFPLTRPDDPYGSNYGKKTITVNAPGDRIYSTTPVTPVDWNKASYDTFSGTSMATPHATGVVALIRGIHPDFTAAQTVELLKKQAGYDYDLIAPPTDGAEFRGAGLVNAYAAVTKDQPQPKVQSVEYSTDGGNTWASFADGTRLTGTVEVRATVGGSVSAVTLSSGDVKEQGTAEAGKPVTVTLKLDYSKLAKDADSELSIAADGLNSAPDADDDISQSVHFVAAAADKGNSGNKPGTGTGDANKDHANTAKPSAKKPGMPLTGSDIAAIAAAVAVLVVAGGVVLAVRRRA